MPEDYGSITIRFAITDLEWLRSEKAKRGININHFVKTVVAKAIREEKEKEQRKQFIENISHG